MAAVQMLHVTQAGLDQVKWWQYERNDADSRYHHLLQALQHHQLRAHTHLHGTDVCQVLL